MLPDTDTDQRILNRALQPACQALGPSASLEVERGRELSLDSASVPAQATDSTTQPSLSAKAAKHVEHTLGKLEFSSRAQIAAWVATAPSDAAARAVS
ncbi:MAG TPA: hypothetical protein VGJ60_21515 [Chloroflexota bacterium]|jgi:hypothetical protein